MFPWLKLTSTRLPKKVADNEWEKARIILPTLERLQRWGTVQHARCPNCGNTETEARCRKLCGIATTFWRLVHRCMPSIGVAQNYTRGHCPRDAYGRLVLAAGEYVLWRNHCGAVGGRRRLRLQWPLLARLRRILLSFLETQLVTHGEVEFLRHWSCPFVSVVDGKVILSAAFRDVEVY
ncbi:hypothetical protein HPB49_025228 [Dermacentor silvarum]|uniref:Uncharacterized protein n=1 Tax=Dermacentor silvarum TaxID=543639 RepID=A0ACB8DHF0_DERSI|nr:hypothetical protein HPB49_025228 [Dermacentor silvarum]